jgi:CubicO group peptidase (beta-lactamase class C family)
MKRPSASSWISAAGVAVLVACGGDPTTPSPADTSSTPVSTDLSSIVDTVRLTWKMPAMGAAIVTLENGVTALAVAGTRRATGGAVVSKDDLWHLGSNTKAMTALLVAVAVSQNRIQWTTTVAQAFPELANIRPDYRDVTLREILSHQGGMTRDANTSEIAGDTEAAQRSSAVAWAVQQPPAATRGTYSYSNVDYVIAGTMVERAFGMSYEAAMKKYVYAPLGIADAGWGPQAAAGSTTQPVAHLLLGNGTWLAREGFDIPSVYNSSGRAHMSLASWARVLREVLRVEAGTSTVAPADVARETTSPVTPISPGTSYGFGWVVSTRAWANGKVLFHDGSNTANHSLTFVAPQRNVAFLVTTNGYDPSGRSSNALNALINRLITFHDTGR